MSNALFDEVLTLYLPTEEGYVRRVIPTVRTERTWGEAGLTVKAYIPLHGRRSLRYVPPSRFDPTRRSLFSVTVGTLLVPERCSDALPPESALSVEAVAVRIAGSRRLHHLVLTAKERPSPSSPSEEENNQTNESEEETL